EARPTRTRTRTPTRHARPAGGGGYPGCAPDPVAARVSGACSVRVRVWRVACGVGVWRGAWGRREGLSHPPRVELEQHVERRAQGAAAQRHRDVELGALAEDAGDEALARGAARREEVVPRGRLGAVDGEEDVAVAHAGLGGRAALEAAEDGQPAQRGRQT